MARQYIIYCDESEDRGTFYSNFYGGALIKASDRQAIEETLEAARKGVTGEAKWTKITEQDERHYIAFAGKFLELIGSGLVKMRVMFTQNIHSTDHIQYEDDASYFKLYYQFIKHSFGLMYCKHEEGSDEIVRVTIYLDDAPDTKAALDNFKDYLASIKTMPEFFQARVWIDREDIADVDSKQHVILQAVDVILGAIQFRLNGHHKIIPAGKCRRGKRTRAKERVYKFINKKLREMYPHFNIGVTTGQLDGPHVRWSHPYRHWCFKPAQSVMDRTRGKKRRKRR